MAFYEHIVLARQDISSQQAEELTNRIKSVISENGGKTSRTEYWGLRSIAYKIKKNRKAHYTLINVDAPHQAMAEVERQLSINEDVLRFMTIRVDQLDEEPSTMMQRRDRDDDRKPN